MSLSNTELTRIGCYWASEEEKQLLDELDNNISIYEISKNHKRNVGGITSRIEHMARKMFHDKKDINEIIKLTKLSESEIIKSVEKNNVSRVINNHLKNNNSDDLKDIKNELSKLNKNIELLIETIITK